MLLHRPKDLLSSLVFVVTGIAAFIGANAYEVGTANRMGPGYLPAAIGLALVAVGLSLLVTALRKAEPDPIEHHAIEPLVLILLGVVAFAFLIDRAGLVAALAAMVFFACARRLLSHPVEVVITYVVLTAFCAFLFVYLLGLHIPLFW